MTIEVSGAMLAALGSSIIIILGVIYKSYRLIRTDAYLDHFDSQYLHIPKDKVKYIHVETAPTEIDLKLMEIKKIINDMEYSNGPKTKE